MAALLRRSFYGLGELSKFFCGILLKIKAAFVKNPDIVVLYYCRCNCFTTKIVSNFIQSTKWSRIFAFSVFPKVRYIYQVKRWAMVHQNKCRLALVYASGLSRVKCNLNNRLLQDLPHICLNVNIYISVNSSCAHAPPRANRGALDNLKIW